MFGLHGLGKFTSLGRSLGGWNWAELGGLKCAEKTENIPPEKSGTFKDGHSLGWVTVWQLQLYVADILSCGRYSISCLGLYTFL